MSPTMVVSTTTTFLTDRLDRCPSCGFDMGSPDNHPTTRLLESQARIVELETQICLLNQKLRLAQQPPAPVATAPAAALPNAGERAPRVSLFQTGASRISALVYPRGGRGTNTATSTSTSSSSSTPAAAATGPSVPTAPTSPPKAPLKAAPEERKKLLEALEREQKLRRAAENRLSATSKEVEELSAALFEQANEMVADERRARAKLEERVGELERRDVDKKRRLDRLETAVLRIERARDLLRES